MKRFIAMLFVVALVAAACGDSSGEVTTTAAVADPPATSAPVTTVPAPTTSEAPSTSAPAETTTVPAASIVPGEDPEVDAIVVAFGIAFDSTSDYAAKALYIDDPSGLEQTVADYLSTGENFGGIDVVAKWVVIDGETARVGYDLLFGGNPTYPDLEGEAVRTAEGWKVPRTQFCSLMRSARVGCPTA